MNEKELTFGIVGSGSIAGFHAACIGELDHCSLVAVSSSSPERAQKAEEKFKVPAYSDFRKMMAEKKLDIICICNESGGHLEPVLEAASRGIHVLTEKPMEVTLERADKMIQACQSAGVKLGCIFQNRFGEAFQQVKRAVEEGKLGKLLMGNAYIKWFRDDSYYKGSQWRGTIKGDGGAALINQGIHTIDLLLHLFGGVESVYGQIGTMTHAIEGEDVGTAILSFNSGAMGTIQGSTSFFPGYPERLEVYGEKGSIVLEGGKISAWNIQDMESPVEISSLSLGSGASNPMAISHQLHLLQFKDFVEAVRLDREPRIDGKEGRKALELILAIYESSKKKGRIFL